MVKSSYHVVPRALADDLSIWGRAAAGDTHGQQDMQWQNNWRDAVEATLQFLIGMGATPAHNKSLTLGSTKELRRWLKRIKWDHDRNSIPTTTRTRDLGAFFNSTNQRLAGITVTRMKRGA